MIEHLTKTVVNLPHDCFPPPRILFLETKRMLKYRIDYWSKR